MQRFKNFLALGALTTLLCVATLVLADPSYPGWWLDYDIAPAQPPASANTTAYNAWMKDNYAPATLGQLKNVATQTRLYLNDKLASVGGAGPDIDNVIANFTISDPNNFAPSTLGQLKYIAKPFYDRLTAVGFNTTADINYRLTGNTTGNWTHNVPWNPATNTSVNYGPATLGQLKFVFAFDLTAGSAGNFTVAGNVSSNSGNIPDAWLVSYGLDPFDYYITGEDPAGDGWTVAQAYSGNFSPVDPNSAPPPSGGVVEGPTELNVSPLSYNVSTGVPVFDGEGLYLSWNYDDVANITYQIIRQRKALDSTAAETPEVIASNVTTKLFNDDTVSTDYMYRYWVRAKLGATYSGYSEPAPNHGWMRPVPAVDSEGFDASDPQVEPNSDFDGDGLSNYEEFREGTNPGAADSDGDGVPDGEDALPLDSQFKFDRVDPPHYAFIDLGPGTYLASNNNGDVLYYDGNDTVQFWSAGNITPIEQDEEDDNTYTWAMVTDDGLVLGTYGNGTDFGFATWDADDGISRQSFFDYADENLEGEVTGWNYIGDSYFVTQNGVYAGISFETQTYIATDADDFDVFETNHYDVFLHLALNGTSEQMGDMVGDYTNYEDNNPDTTAATSANISYIIATDSANDTLAITFTANYTTANVTSNYIVDYDGDEPVYANFTYTHKHLNDTSYHTTVTLNDLEIADPITETERIIPPSDFVDLGTTYKQVLINIDGNPILLNPFAGAGGKPATFLTIRGDHLVNKVLRNPDKSVVQLRALGSLFYGLTGDTDPLYFNGRTQEADEVCLPEGDDLPAIAAVANNSTVVIGTSSSGNLFAAASLYIDPNYHHNMPFFGSSPSWVSANLSGNSTWIKNPAVIVEGDTVQLIAHIDNFFYRNGGLPYWITDTTSGAPGNTSNVLLGNHTGSSSSIVYPGDNHHGTATQMSGFKEVTLNVTGGNQEGRARISITWDRNSDNNPSPLFISGSDQPTYETYVGPLLQLKCRFQLLYYYAELLGTYTTPAPSVGNIVDGMAVANTYLRQAGIQLVLDSNTTIMNTISGLDGNIHINSISGSDVSIFDVYVANTPYTGNSGIASTPFRTFTDLFFNQHITGASPGAVNTNGVETFLANNHRANVLQIAIMGNDVDNVIAGANTHSAYPLTANISGNVSNLDYIVSLNDTGDLTADHHLNVLGPATFTFYSDASGASSSGLVGIAMYSIGSSLGHNGILDYKNLFGQELAHEVGHALGLNHRFGNTHDFFDGLETQSNPNGASLLGHPGTNLMDYVKRVPTGSSDDLNIPEDIDLHQALIMRYHAALQ